MQGHTDAVFEVEMQDTPDYALMNDSTSGKIGYKSIN